MACWIGRFVLSICGILALLLAIPAGDAPAGQNRAPRGAVLLTIAGDIERSNRGAIDLKLDGIFKFHEIKFDHAFAFDRAMLEALPQVEFTAQLPEGHERAVFKGPRLEAVLEMAGAAGAASLTTTALDGYVTELTAKDIGSGSWILVLSRNGQPFGIGGFGPVMLMQKPKSPKVDEAAQWPWALFYIAVKK